MHHQSRLTRCRPPYTRDSVLPSIHIVSLYNWLMEGAEDVVTTLACKTGIFINDMETYKDVFIEFNGSVTIQI